MASIKNAISNLYRLISNANPLSPHLIETYNQSREWGYRQKLCYAPFSSMFINTLGMIRPCYANFINDQYPDKSLHDIWFGQKFDKIRKQMNNNNLSGACEFCRSSIVNNNFGGLLTRKYDNPQFHADKTPSKKNKIYPKIIEFELSNACNLECLMCDGKLSSAIRKNREKKPPLTNIYDDRFLQQLKEFIPHLKVAEFAGGSPFLISIYYEIWDMILAMNPSCNILITTSANTMNKKIKELIRRGRFNFNISIDSLQKENYEHIRVNANFDKVIDNIRFYHNYCQENGTTLCLLVCPLRLNWREFPDFINFANKMNVLVYFHTVFKPVYLALWSLPPSELKDIHRYLSEYEFPENTKKQKTNKQNYLTLVSQIKTWQKKAVVREKEELKRENILQKNIAASKKIFFDKLRRYVHEKNGLSESSINEKISELCDQIDTVVRSLPDIAPQEIIYLELAKYKICEIMEAIEAGNNDILYAKANKIHKSLYKGLRDNAYSIKYADENSKYQLNMQY